MTSPFKEMADHLIEVFDLKISRQAVAAHLREQEWNLRATSRAQPLLREDLDHFASSRPQTILFQKSELLFLSLIKALTSEKHVEKKVNNI